MRTLLTAVAALVSVSIVAGCGGGHMALSPSTPVLSGGAPQSVTFATNYRRVCSADAPAGYAHCDSMIRTDVGGSMFSPNVLAPNVANGPYRPTDLRSAYKLPSTTKGAGQTVAIVDAFNDPNAEADMNKYRSTFGISACTSAGGCFKKVNQNGVAGSYPTSNSDWGLEISLDLDMVSAICPKCKIILVEAASSSVANLSTAANRAITMGANVVSNSYGGSESSSFASSPFNHPGHIIVASSGDNGTGAQMPCSFSSVVCVGGTKLVHATNARGWSETVWNDLSSGGGATGSGCSALVTKPAWQTDMGCHKRSEADLSAVADPNTGVFVYDSFAGCTAPNCFWEAGGTSASAPIVAAAYALAANEAAQTYAKSIWTHGGTSSFFDVTSGSNGSCAIAYICRAEVKYDGPSGWGTPDGISAL